MIRPNQEKKVLAGYQELAKKIDENSRDGSTRLKLRAARSLLGLTQKEFSEQFGIALDTIKSWEADSRQEPHGIARLLIEMISDDPFRASSIAERFLTKIEAESYHIKNLDKMECL